MDKVKTILRWIAVLPGAVLASIIAGAIGWVMGYFSSSVVPSRLDLIWSTILVSGASGWAFVAGGTWVAPVYKSFVPTSLAIIAVAVGISATFFDPGEVDWVTWARAAISTIASIFAALQIRRAGGIT